MWTAISAAVAVFFDKYKSQFLIVGVALAAILGLCVFGYFDIKHKEKLAAEMAVQKLELEQMVAKQQMIARDQALIIKNSQEMISNLTAIREQAAKQQRLIEKHNLDLIGQKHPKVLEKHINRATREQNKRFEELTKP